MEIIAVFAIALVLTLGSIALLQARKKLGASSSATRVDNYALSVEEKDGFHFVRLKIRTDAGASTFDFDPNYSHVLSDELLTTSAMAIRNAHVPAK